MPPIGQVMIEVKKSKRHNVGGFALQPIPKGIRFTTNIPVGFRGFNYDAKPNIARIKQETNQNGALRDPIVVIALHDIKIGQELVLPPYKGKDWAFTTKNNKRALDSAGFGATL